jgi:hypothetical protein
LRGGGTKESMKAAAESPAAFHLFLLFHKRRARCIVLAKILQHAAVYCDF